MGTVLCYTLTILASSLWAQVWICLMAAGLVISFACPLPHSFRSPHLAQQAVLYTLWLCAMTFIPSFTASLSKAAAQGGLVHFWRVRKIAIWQQHAERVAASCLYLAVLGTLWLPIAMVLQHDQVSLGKGLRLYLEQLALLLSYGLVATTMASICGNRSAVVGTLTGIGLPLASLWMAPVLRLWLIQFGAAGKTGAWLLCLLPPAELCFRPAAVIFAWPPIPLLALAAIVAYCTAYAFLLVKLANRV